MSTSSEGTSLKIQGHTDHVFWENWLFKDAKKARVMEHGSVMELKAAP